MRRFAPKSSYYINTLRYQVSIDYSKHRRGVTVSLIAISTGSICTCRKNGQAETAMTISTVRKTFINSTVGKFI